MKKILLTLTALAVVAAPAFAGDTEWFDLANCQMCTHMANEPGFMENVKWENYVLDNGWMTVTVVPASYKKQYDAVHAKMEAEGAKLMGGEEAHLCGFCTNYMTLMGTGKVTMQNFETSGGSISMMTSNDETTIAALQKHAKKTIKEMEKMMASEEHSE